MKSTKVAMRYAKAVYPIAQEQNSTTELMNDIDLIIAYIEKSRELKLFIDSPVISNSKKIGAIKAIFSGKISPLTLNFILLLTSKGREQLIDSVGHCLKLLYNIEKNITTCSVISAFPVEAETKAKIENYLKQTTKHDIDVSYSVDKSILGGIKIKILDTVYDASIQTKLKELKESLTRA